MHAALVALLLQVTPAAVGAPAPDTVVVCPADFRVTVRPWLEHRTRQGHRIALVSNLGTPAQIRQRIIEQSKGGRLKHVLLLGDSDPAMAQNAIIRGRSVPTHYVKAKVNIHWGSEPEIATDTPYADLDGDSVPDVAIGRIPADTPAQLRGMIRKILAYEGSTDFGPWRRQVDFVAGVGGFGQLADSLLETGAKKFITEGIPSPYQTSMTYGSWRSPYCPDPRVFHQTTLESLSRGSLFWVYIGHGHPLTLDRVRVPGSDHHIFDIRDVAKLDCRSGSPIAMFLACYCGAFDAPRDCLSEEMLRQPGGPVAVFSGSRVTMPYAMSTMGMGLMDECFRRRRATLGEVILHAKRGMILARRGFAQRLMLDVLAKAISPKGTDLADERMEHVQLFNLLGDPLLRLRHPQPVTLTVKRSAKAGGELVVEGECKMGGRCTVELAVRRDRLPFAHVPREQFDARDVSLKAYQEVYRRANNPRIVSVNPLLVDGRFRTTLQIPATAYGACCVRV